MVTANSCSSRPMIPPMNNSGIKTAASDRVMERMVKPISLAPSIAACIGVLPISMWRTMFSSMTMASSTTNPTDERQRHQRKIVQAVAQQVHHRERSDDGHGQSERRDDGGGNVAQEEEDHHDDQSRWSAAG